jgi:hypothetical protein
MKKLLTILLVLALAALPALALVKQVTTVTSAAGVIFTPSTTCQWVTIQNNGGGDVRISFDGVSSPTASTGYLLEAGMQVTIGYGGSGQRPVIRAILVSGSTTLDIVTPDANSY